MIDLLLLYNYKMSWFYYAGGSVLFLTSLMLLQRVIAVDSKSPRAAAVVFNVIAALIAIIIFIVSGAYQNFQLPSSKSAYIFVMIAALMYGIFERGRFLVAKLLDASIFSTIANSSVLVAFIGALLIYSETLTTGKIIGAILIISALILVSYNPHKTNKISVKGILLGILFETFLGLGWMLDKKGVLYFNPDTYNILLWTTPLIFIIFPFIKIKDFAAEFKIGQWKIVILAVLNVVGYWLQLKALELSDATRVIPIVQTSSLFAVLFGIIFLKERDFILKKIIGGILAIGGVYLLVAV